MCRRNIHFTHPRVRAVTILCVILDVLLNADKFNAEPLQITRELGSEKRVINLHQPDTSVYGPDDADDSKAEYYSNPLSGQSRNTQTKQVNVMSKRRENTGEDAHRFSRSIRMKTIQQSLNDQSKDLDSITRSGGLILIPSDIRRKVVGQNEGSNMEMNENGKDPEDYSDSKLGTENIKLHSMKRGAISNSEQSIQDLTYKKLSDYYRNFFKNSQESRSKQNKREFEKKWIDFLLRDESVLPVMKSRDTKSTNEDTTRVNIDPEVLLQKVADAEEMSDNMIKRHGHVTSVQDGGHHRETLLAKSIKSQLEDLYNRRNSLLKKRHNPQHCLFNVVACF